MQAATNFHFDHLMPPKIETRSKYLECRKKYAKYYYKCWDLDSGFVWSLGFRILGSTQYFWTFDIQELAAVNSDSVRHTQNERGLNHSLT